MAVSEATTTEKIYCNRCGCASRHAVIAYAFGGGFLQCKCDQRRSFGKFDYLPIPERFTTRFWRTEEVIEAQANKFSLTFAFVDGEPLKAVAQLVRLRILVEQKKTGE